MDNKDYLEKILPHKKPMILIDDVIDYSIEEGCIKKQFMNIFQQLHYKPKFFRCQYNYIK